MKIISNSEYADLQAAKAKLKTITRDHEKELRDYRKQIEALEDEHQDDLEAAEKKHKAELKRVESRVEAKVEEVETKAKTAQKAHETKMAKEEADLDTKKVELDTKERKLKGREDVVTNREAAVEEAEKEYTKKVKAHADEIVAARNEGMEIGEKRGYANGSADAVRSIHDITKDASDKNHELATKAMEGVVEAAKQSPVTPEVNMIAVPTWAPSAPKQDKQK